LSATLEDPTQIEQANQAQLSNLTQAQLGNLLAQLLGSMNNKGSGSGNKLNYSFNSHFNNSWMIDSGATDYMTGNLNLLDNTFTTTKCQPVTVANGSKVPIEKIGTTKFLSNTVSDVFYLPTFTSNLLSVSKITKEFNCNVIFSPSNVIFQDIVTRKTIGEGKLVNGLYYLDIFNITLAATSMDDNKLWHYRLGHASYVVLNKLLSLKYLDNSACDICRFSKQIRLPFTLSTSKTLNFFELVHSDVWGPPPITSHNNFCYYVIFIDDFSRTTWVYLLTSKDEVFQRFLEFTFFLENQYNTTIKIFRSDNDIEYVNKTFSNYFQKKGILHQTSYIYTPEQNEILERKKHHILEVTRSLLFQMNIPKRFWSEAVRTAIHLINRLPTPVLNHKSPFSVLTN
jgi:GAG-pre-integrase domain/Integrase core domain